MATVTRVHFNSLGDKGLHLQHPAMRLWSKAKKLGIWDPADIDFSQDRVDWRKMSDVERDILLRLSALFQAGEEAVTIDIIPLLSVMAQEGRLEEQMYLTSFLWEEAKHVDAFNHFFQTVVGARTNYDRYLTPSYSQLFLEELPTAMGRLRDDPSPKNQAIASVTYNLIVEGVLAETGYHGYYEVLKKHGVLPGMLKVVGHLKLDESRHLAYGVFLLSRLVAEHGEEIYDVIQNRLNELLPLATGMIHESLGIYDPLPFGLSLDDFLSFSMQQFQLRVARIEKARTQSLEEVMRLGADDVVLS